MEKSIKKSGFPAFFPDMKLVFLYARSQLRNIVKPQKSMDFMKYATQHHIHGNLRISKSNTQRMRYLVLTLNGFFGG